MRTIVLTPAEAQQARDGSLAEIVRPVASDNSTVLGYDPPELWGHLLWGRGAHRDGGYYDSAGYAYLHVKAWNPKDGAPPSDGCELPQYRVRPLWRPGDVVRLTWWESCGDGVSERLESRPIATVDVRQNGDGWEWVVGLVEKQETINEA